MSAFTRISLLSLLIGISGCVCTVISFQTYSGHIAEWRYNLLSVGFFLFCMFPYLFAFSVTLFDKATYRIRRVFSISLIAMQLPPLLTGYNMIRELVGQNDTNSPQQIIIFASALILTTAIHVRYAAEFTKR